MKRTYNAGQVAYAAFTLKVLTHYNESCNENSSLKVEVHIDNERVFCSFSCSVRGP